jgi:hypothetical protein
MGNVNRTDECARFQVLTAASMKIRAFRDVGPCNLVGVDNVSVVRIAYIIRAKNYRPDDGGSTHL